jgi:2,3-dihydro-2,3-dihydroxybenzoate dehydrogenase
MNWDQQLTTEYQGKWVWVTGAAQGIGASVARKFHAIGARVLGFDCQFQDTSYLTTAIKVDFTEQEQLLQVLQQCMAQGMQPYNLINVAGVLELNPLAHLTMAQWQHCQRVNTDAVFLFLRCCLPYLQQQKAGSIVTVSSNAGHTPRQLMAAYGASKAAATQLTLTAGLELANFGVRANVIAPGSTLTTMQTSMWQDAQGEQQVIQGNAAQYKLGIPLQKLATADEIAQTVVFVASSLSSHTTLQVITIDGGATL